MGDLLLMDKINALPHPLWFNGWPVHDIDVETGCYRVDVCGLLDIGHVGGIITFKDGEGNSHFIDDFYNEDSQP